MIQFFPAIDLRGGRVVRLHQGGYDRETTYNDDPVSLACGFVAAGARWIHVVDLDAARTGNPVNRPIVADIATAVSGRAHVQTGGGVRTVADATVLARAGVARVVMGSAAVQAPELVARVASVVPVAVGLDHRGGLLAFHGWTEATDLHVLDALERFPAAAAFVVTDIGRDGTLAGPDLAGLADVTAKSPLPVVASGGVATLDDLCSLRAIAGLSGVIVGKALYEVRFTVQEALDVLGRPG